MKKRALFIDFDDSFTWNVVQELEASGLDVTIMHWMDFETLPDTDLLVLGPGPGHPDDYQRIFPLLTEWLSKEKPFFGVCLGHQIFWRLRGENVYRSREPIHGHPVNIELNHDWQNWLSLPSEVRVQRYNSLTVTDEVATRNPDVKLLSVDGEVMISRGSHFLTYQFHPESVGTSYRRSFFRPLARLLV